MTVSEAILARLKALPDPVQKEVLDFIEFLESRRAGCNASDASDAEWNRLSLASAMRGMEEEESPYTRDDLKESFHD